MKNRKVLSKFTIALCIIFVSLLLSQQLFWYQKSNPYKSISSFISFVEDEDDKTTNNSQNKNIDSGDCNIIFEYLNSKNLYMNYPFLGNSSVKELHPIIKVEDSDIDAIPHFDYINLEDFSDIGEAPIESISIKYSKDIYSKFTYRDGLYHFLGSDKAANSNSNSDIKVSNIIVQLIDDTHIEKLKKDMVVTGTGYLFSGGKIIDIRWNRRKKQPIKITDESGNPICLVKGKVWWAIINKDCVLDYN